MEKKLYTVLALLLATPQIYTAEEDAAHDFVIVEHSDGRNTDEIAEQKQTELQRLQDMRKPTDTFSRTSTTSNTPVTTNDAATTKATFTEPTTWQKISNFFSSIFGDSGVVRDALRSKHTMSNEPQTQLSEEQTAAFNRLRPEQQLQDLNEWVKTEQEKFESATDRNKIDDITRAKDVEKNRQDKNKQITERTQTLNKNIASFKTTFAKLPEEARSNITLPDPLTAQGIDSVMNDLSRNQYFSAEKTSASLIQLRSQLQDLHTDISTDAQRNAQDRANIVQKARSSHHASLDTQISNQDEFNKRIARFQKEMQDVISEKNPGIQLKYNVNTGEFEYHTATSTPERRNSLLNPNIVTLPIRTDFTGTEGEVAKTFKGGQPNFKEDSQSDDVSTSSSKSFASRDEDEDVDNPFFSSGSASIITMRDEDNDMPGTTAASPLTQPSTHGAWSDSSNDSFSSFGSSSTESSSPGMTPYTSTSDEMLSDNDIKSFLDDNQPLQSALKTAYESSTDAKDLMTNSSLQKYRSELTPFLNNRTNAQALYNYLEKENTGMPNIKWDE